eukprot:4611801-Amphidinium_carterae.1
MPDSTGDGHMACGSSPSPIEFWMPSQQSMIHDTRFCARLGSAPKGLSALPSVPHWTRGLAHSGKLIHVDH